IIARVRNPERDAPETLFVGPAELCRAAMNSPAFSSGRDYRAVGFVDSNAMAGAGALGSIADFQLLLAATGAEVVVVCGFLTDGQFHDVVDAALAGGCQILSVPRAVDIAGVHPTTVWRGGQVLIELNRPALKGRQLFLKRLLDLTGSTLGLILFAPFFAVICAAIKLESRGPAVFSHRRLGLNGQVFRCMKFRSM